MKFAHEKEILPAFPKTPHLSFSEDVRSSYRPNSDKTDRIADAAESSIAICESIWVEEKIDGASCGMTLHKGEPLIRNRDHILRKGYYKKTAAKMQFASVWNWFYDNKERFVLINDAGPYSVYGEWCVAQHGIAYTQLPDWFIAYDIYDYEKHRWLEPTKTRRLLTDAGFHCPVWFFAGELIDPYREPVEEACRILEEFMERPSAWSTSRCEGIYIKIDDGEFITHRFKMVRPDYVRGALWNPKKVTKNSLAKKV